MTEPQRRNNPPDAAFIQYHEHPFKQAFAQVRQPPTHHAILRKVRTLAQPFRQLGFFFIAQLCRCSPAMRAIRQAGNAFLIIADHPIPQGLAIHTTAPGRFRPRAAFQNKRQAKQPRRRLAISVSRRRPQIRCVVLPSRDLRRHRNTVVLDGHLSITPLRAEQNHNRVNTDAAWYYIRLVEVEQAFKTLKGDLAMRPLFHQKEDRIEAHIFVAFLAFALHATLHRRLRSLAPGLTPRAVLAAFGGMQMIDVHVPTTDGRALMLSRHTEPEKDVRLLLERLKLNLPPQPPPRISAAQAAVPM